MDSQRGSCVDRQAPVPCIIVLAIDTFHECQVMLRSAAQARLTAPIAPTFASVFALCGWARCEGLVGRVLVG